MPSSPLYPYTLLRSKRKTLALQITREGEIVVRSPLKLPEEEIRRFVAEKSPWIQKHLEQISARHSQALPPLSQEQQEALEKDILQNGCYSPLIVDQKLRVVDGHNRLLICQDHEIPYTMLVFEFEDALEAKQWALDTQKGRRNLDNWELGKIALKLKPDVEARAKKNMSAGGQA